MTEQAIIDEYKESNGNAVAKLRAVNALRHLMMDGVKFDVKDDDQYRAVYQRVMLAIASCYPLLSWEVKRQMAKKERRQVRNAREKSKVSVHI